MVENINESSIQENSPHQCDECQKWFPNMSQLMYHYFPLKRDPPKVIKFNCCFCQRLFNTKFEYIHHLKIHLNLKHKCRFCKKTFSSNIRLIEHINYIHLGQKPFPCTICNKSFFKKNELIEHLTKIHGAIHEDLSI